MFKNYVIKNEHDAFLYREDSKYGFSFRIERNKTCLFESMEAAAALIKVLGLENCSIMTYESNETW